MLSTLMQCTIWRHIYLLHLCELPLGWEEHPHLIKERKDTKDCREHYNRQITGKDSGKYTDTITNVPMSVLYPMGGMCLPIGRHVCAYRAVGLCSLKICHYRVTNLS